MQRRCGPLTLRAVLGAFAVAAAPAAASQNRSKQSPRATLLAAVKHIEAADTVRFTGTVIDSEGRGRLAGHVAKPD